MAENQESGIGKLAENITGGLRKIRDRHKILSEIKSDQAGMSKLAEEGQGESFEAAVGRAKIFSEIDHLDQLNRKKK